MTSMLQFKSPLFLPETKPERGLVAKGI